MQNQQKGLGFSENCQEWLEKLNVFSWQDLVILAPMKNVETLMRSLTIGGYHKHRQDLRKLICFGKICDTTVKQVQPTTKNTRSWHTRYLLRLHNDLPLIPAKERKAVATILQNSPKVTENPNHTPPDIITVPFEQWLHSDRGSTNW